ncbi:CPBP family intramembrane glutamic endopeptidase [Pseudoramibacter sp.]|jgi:membrane protease YdiL (CAAX protease family)|uniref:CPBP family intramembrane glutamic endopeptidase n=1 Tax=Pseudoramibacter sp. TaxID=2034862 RepID=UPI0025ED7385|nr:type II CAAX endopeptidase family protein [Pseudoramibacter sp.]MCH4071836.1 CPBP family intramembrane metalloprotease [Pseudoramibacter sp.]MCH4105605.1 CPBP family intramembrane metalloprotease [Pseudoramibacter sp.]
MTLKRKISRTVRDVASVLALLIISRLIGVYWPKTLQAHFSATLAHMVWGSLVYAALVLIGLYFLNKYVFHDRFRLVGFPPAIRSQYFAWGAWLVGMFYGGTLATGARLVLPASNPQAVAQMAVSAFDTALIAPFVEELVFRGVILPRIAKHHGVRKAILISSVLFGVLHMMNGRMDALSAVQTGVAITLIGMLLSLICLKEKSIWASFTVHAMNNLIELVFPMGTSVRHDWPVNLVLTSSRRFVAGGAYGADTNGIYMAAAIVMMVWIVSRSKPLQKALGFNV